MSEELRDLDHGEPNCGVELIFVDVGFEFVAGRFHCWDAAEHYHRQHFDIYPFLRTVQLLMLAGF